MIHEIDPSQMTHASVIKNEVSDIATDILDNTGINIKENNVEEIFSPLVSRGYRLKRLEILNFGTYDGGPHIFNYQGESALHTGPNGAGKTTALDSLRFLLRERPKYNSATGDTKKANRDIRGYVFGIVGGKDAKNRRDINHKVLRKVESDFHTGVLAVFQNKIGKTYSLCRLIKYSDPKPGSKASHVFVTYEGDLSIERHFDTWRPLNKLIKTLPEHAQTHNSFSKYIAAINNAFGIPSDYSERAWNLWETAIVAKELISLDNFMRQYVMPASELATVYFEDLIKATESLHEAYEAIKAIREKIDLLEPVDELIVDYEHLTRELSESIERQDRLIKMRNVVRHRSSLKRTEWFKQKNIRLDTERKNIEDDIKILEEQQLALNTRLAGFTDIADIDRRILEKQKQKQNIGLNLDVMKNTLAGWNVRVPHSWPDCNREEWMGTVKKLENKISNMPGQINLANKDRDTATINHRQYQQQITALQNQIQAALDSNSSIPLRYLKQRASLATALSVNEDDLPFAGELIKVNDSALKDGWNDAINKLLRNFAIRLLIPENLHERALHWINENNLGIRLECEKALNMAMPDVDVSMDSLIRKLDIRENHPYEAFMYSTLMAKYDYRCVDIREFAGKHARGKLLTKEGQNRSGNFSVKDDRPEISGPGQGRLGWSSENLVQNLTAEIKITIPKKDAAQVVLDEKSSFAKHLIRQQQTMETTRDRMMQFEEFDITFLDRELQTLQRERDAFTEQGKEADKIKDEIETATIRINELRQERDDIRTKITINNVTIENLAKIISRTEDELDQQSHIKIRPSDAKWVGDFHRQDGITPLAHFQSICQMSKPEDNIGGFWGSIEKIFADVADKIKKERTNVAGRLQRNAQKYLNAFRDDESNEVQIADLLSDSPACRNQWRNRLEYLLNTKLRQHEERFEKDQTEAAISRITQMSVVVEEELRGYREIIKGINETLRGMKYDPQRGTEIRFECRDIGSEMVIGFKRDLRNLQSKIDPSNDLSALKQFEYIDKFIKKYDSSRQGDARNLALIKLDTRNWVGFVGKEISYSLETGEEEVINTIKGSKGASGGQQMRLAFTAITAGLSYVFGCKDSSRADNSFRMMMLDEAFDKYHSSSVRTSMKLLGEFGLQSIMATPANHVATLADFVKYAIIVSQNPQTWRTSFEALEIKEHFDRLNQLQIEEAWEHYKKEGMSRDQFDEIIEEIAREQPGGFNAQKEENQIRFDDETGVIKGSEEAEDDDISDFVMPEGT